MRTVLFLFLGTLAMAVTNDNRYWLASPSVAFGVADTFPTGGVLRVKGHESEWTSFSEMAYNDRLDAITLAPQPRETWETDNLLADYTLVGDWTQCKPPGEQVYFLRNLNAAPDQGTVSATQDAYDLTAYPCVAWKIYRAARPAGTTEAGSIALTLRGSDQIGGAPEVTVTIADAAVTLTFNWIGSGGGDSYDFSRDWTLTPEESARIVGPGLVQVDLWMAARRAFVFVSPINRLFVLGPEDDALKVGPFVEDSAKTSVTGVNAGAFATNVSQVKFAETGAVTTPFLECLTDVSGYDDPTLTPYPAGAEVVLGDALADGTGARYEIAINGDGWSPCPIQALGVEYPASWGTPPRGNGWLEDEGDPFNPPTTARLPGVQQASETYPEDSLQRSGTLSLDITAPADRATLRRRSAAYLGGETAYRGLNAVVFEVGPAGGTVTRFIGVVKDVEEEDALTGQRTVRYTVGGRATLWADQAPVTVPGLWGRDIGDALRLILERAGVYCDAGGDFVDDGDVTSTIPDPGWGYADEPLSGSNTLEAVRKLCSEHGAVLRDREDGKLYLLPRPTPPSEPPALPQINADAPASEPEYVASLSRRQPYTTAYTRVIVTGRAPNGTRTRGTAAVAGSALPYPQVLAEDVGDRAPDNASAQAIADSKAADLRSGQAELIAVNRGTGWYDWWSGDFVRVTDAALDLSAALFRITNMQIDFEEGQRIMPVTLTLTEESEP